MRGWSLLITVLAAACQRGEGPDEAVTVRVSATCADIEGAPAVRRGEQPYWEALERGSVLRDGDWVRTPAGGSAHLELLEGGRLDLLENAVVVIEPIVPGEAPVADAGPRVAIEAGEVRATVPLEANAGLRIRRPDGVTVALASATNGSGPAVYRVSATDAGVEIARVDTPREPPPPDELPAPPPRPNVHVPVNGFPASVAPGIDARVKFDPRGWVRLSWSAVAAASAYRVETARDLSFTQETHHADVNATTWLMRPDGVGLYVWRVAAIDDKGQVGEFGFARRLFVELEAPTDLLLAPADGFASATSQVAFSWKPSSQATSYRLMVSKGPDPQRQALFNEVTQGTSTTVSSLAPGTYHWGVYEDGTVLRPLFLKPRKLSVKATKTP